MDSKLKLPKTTKRELINEDPISGELGAHPMGTGLGAALGSALAGAALGTIAGPILPWESSEKNRSESNYFPRKFRRNDWLVP